MQEELTIEQAFDKLEKLIEHMETEIPLEESFDLYKEGVELIKMCNDKLDKVEKKIMILEENGELGDEF
ncbi:MAG: exodeoxyribonuclease VII small subunit [Lachnospiraceae bacterium]|nr:exodeoxyribonuclease VII small subunit [Lachnospiraceae bacterium]